MDGENHNRVKLLPPSQSYPTLQGCCPPNRFWGCCGSDVRPQAQGTIEHWQPLVCSRFVAVLFCGPAPGRPLNPLTTDGKIHTTSECVGVARLPRRPPHHLNSSRHRPPALPCHCWRNIVFLLVPTLRTPHYASNQGTLLLTQKTDTIRSSSQ